MYSSTRSCAVSAEASHSFGNDLPFDWVPFT